MNKKVKKQITDDRAAYFLLCNLFAGISADSICTESFLRQWKRSIIL